jgi:hypothetical protein
VKVLVTGGRSSISNRSPENRNFECSVWAVHRACELRGWDCDVRVIECGETLEDYDAVFVEPPNPTWITARHAAGALWALRRREDAVVLYTHHDMRALFGGLRKLLEDPSLLERRKNRYERKHLSDVLIATAMLLGGAGPWRHLVHCHPWGDRMKLLEEMPITIDDLITYDPSALLPTIPVTPSPSRHRLWVHAAWENHTKWIQSLNLSWQVDRYGRKSAGAMGKSNLPALMVEYAHAVGSLVHPYSHSGSGYFRSRYVHALRGGAILGVNDADAHAMSKTLFAPPATIELMSDDELRELATFQRDWYWSHSWGEDQASARVHLMVLASSNWR